MSTATLSKPADCLPNEVLLHIAELLPIADTLSLLRVKRAYYRVGVGVYLKTRGTVDVITSPADSGAFTINPCLYNPAYAFQIRSVNVDIHRHSFW